MPERHPPPPHLTPAFPAWHLLTEEGGEEMCCKRRKQAARCAMQAKCGGEERYFYAMPCERGGEGRVCRKAAGSV